MIEASRVRAAPPLLRIVIGIDPPGSARPGADSCGIVAVGVAADERIYVLEDASVGGLSPAGWATKAVALFHRLKADALVAEVNLGGDMVHAVIQQIDASVPLRTVHATPGKWLRAEPVAMMYQQGRVKHVDPPLQALEDEMCDFRMGRAVLRGLARSARCAGLGGHRTYHARHTGRAEGQDAVTGRLNEKSRQHWRPFGLMRGSFRRRRPFRRDAG